LVSHGDGCQEVAEGTCDANVTNVAVSNGDNCGSYNRYAYVYFMCGYSWNSGNTLWNVVESPTCVNWWLAIEIFLAYG
jgi:hypothetical protein